MTFTFSFIKKDVSKNGVYYINSKWLCAQKTSLITIFSVFANSWNKYLKKKNKKIKKKKTTTATTTTTTTKANIVKNKWTLSSNVWQRKFLSI